MTTRVAPGTPTADRIRAHVAVDVNGCWVWQCRLGRDGYGRITVGGKRGRWVHRVSYETFVGPIPDGLTVDHVCFTRACVNPAHLRLLTGSENSANQRIRFRTHCGKGHEFSPENTRISDKGHRRCRACDRVNSAAYSRRKAEGRNRG